jgi:hypothetical protein
MSKTNERPAAANSRKFIEEPHCENFVDDTDFLGDETAEAREPVVGEDEPAKPKVVWDETYRNILHLRLGDQRFIPWLQSKGYDRDSVTPQLIDEYDRCRIEAGRKKWAQHQPQAIVEKLDPESIDLEEWAIATEHWVYEEHRNAAEIPLERPRWEALLHRARARLKERQDEERQERRQLEISSLTPPAEPKVELFGKSILDLHKARSQTREELAAAWQEESREQRPEIKLTWNLYHENVGEMIDIAVRIKPRTPSLVDFCSVDIEDVKQALAHPDYASFQRFSAAIGQALDQAEADLAAALNPPPGSRPALKGWSFSDINENEGSAWLVPGLIPHGLTFLFGQPKSGKSLWMQKLSACIAGGVSFDGIDGLQHGRVLYVTRDIGASRQEVKKRLIKMLPRLGLSEDALNGKLNLVDEPFYLNDATSVDNLLLQNPGSFALVVIDSLFRCTLGSLSQDVVASAAVEGMDTISRATGAAVIAIHHEPRGGEHLFGSVALDAAYDAKVHVERGKDRNSVVVTVQELKNAPLPSSPLCYRIEEEFLAPVAGTNTVPAKPAEQTPSRHQEMLALLPDRWVTRKEGRTLVEHLLTGGPEARRKQWQRAVAAMKADGKIEVRKNSLRKT